MGLVMQNTMIKDFMDKFVVTDGTATTISKAGTVHATIMEYPAQGEFTEAIKFAMIEKPFINFAAACGDKGAMTADMIVAEYPEFPEDVAKVVADDFAMAYGNYVVIPEGVTLFISVPPLNSVSDLQEKVEATVEETSNPVR